MKQMSQCRMSDDEQANKFKHNQHYYDWEKSTSKVYLGGGGVDHEFMVRKNFGRGTHKLKLGGPFSADPIFIKCSSKKAKR